MLLQLGSEYLKQVVDMIDKLSFLGVTTNFIKLDFVVWKVLLP